MWDVWSEISGGFIIGYLKRYLRYGWFVTGDDNIGLECINVIEYVIDMWGWEVKSGTTIYDD